MTYKDRAFAALKESGIRTERGGYYTYAASVALGHQCLSGADPRGKAKRFGGTYYGTRVRVLRALTKAGVAHEERGAHNRRYLVDNETGREVGA